MKESTDSPGELQADAISQAYGQFLHTFLAQAIPSESSIHLDELEKRAQSKLAAALPPPPSANLHRLAITAGVEALREIKQQSDQQSLRWIDLQDSALPTNPEQIAQTAQEALARLPEARRRAVGLHLAGLTSTEIAALMNWAENKTTQQLEKGTRSLRAALRAVGIDYETE